MKILIEINDLDEKVLQHDLLDVQQWVLESIDGKINNVKKRLLKEAQENLFKDSEIDTMPASENKLLELYFSRPYYKNRIMREELIKKEENP